MLSEEEIPNHWEWVEFEEAVNILDRQRDPIKKSVREERTEEMDKSEMIPYYGASGQTGWIDDYIFDKELVLLGEDGAPFSNPAAEKLSYMIDGKSWVSNHAHVLEGKDGIMINKFLCYVLRSINYTPYVNGSTRKKLTQRSMKKINLPVPPLEEQEMIVERLDEIFGSIDEIQYAQDIAEEKYEIAFQSTLREYIPSKTSNVENVPFGEIGEIYGGGTPSRSKDEYWNGSIPWVSAKDMGERRISDSQDHMTEEAFENSTAAKDVPENSIIFVMRSSILEHTFPVSLTEDMLTINQDLKALIPEEGINPEYLLYTLLRYEKRILRKCSKEGTTVASLDSDPLYEFELPIPPLKEQKEIVEKIKIIDSKVDRISEYVKSHDDRFEHLPKSVLSEAFKGNIVDFQPDDAEDEQDESGEGKELKFDGEGQQTLKMS